MADADQLDLKDITLADAWVSALKSALNNIPIGQTWLLAEFAMLEPELRAGKKNYNHLGANMHLRLGSPKKQIPDRKIGAGFPAMGNSDQEEAESAPTLGGESGR